MSDLDQLENTAINTPKPLSTDELKKRLGGQPFVRGDTVMLGQIDYALKKVMVGVGWDIPGADSDGVDVDCSVFLLNKEDKTREDSDFVFYNNLTGCDGAVEHMGDNRTGAGDGDDERVLIDLNAIPFDVQKMVFVISVYNADLRDQHIGLVNNLFIRLVNADTDIEIFRYPIVDVPVNKASAALIAGELVREGPAWMFTAKGELYEGTLGILATQYGMMVTG
jgi:tellurium resistance protein TerD